MSRLLQHGVTARAQARPEATALMLRNERVSYGELEATASPC
jgi:hypothetical protein